MRETRRQRGFVLTLVIVALGWLGVMMAVLAGACNSMLFHADRAQAQAVERNLMVSGLAWARHQVQRPEGSPEGLPVELDVSAFSIPHAQLEVSLAPIDATSASVAIEASCTKGRQTRRGQRRCKIAKAR